MSLSVVDDEEAGHQSRRSRERSRGSPNDVTRKIWPTPWRGCAITTDTTLMFGCNRPLDAAVGRRAGAYLSSSREIARGPDRGWARDGRRQHGRPPALDAEPAALPDADRLFHEHAGAGA
jgi:hypothetical protein